MAQISGNNRYTSYQIKINEKNLSSEQIKNEILVPIKANRLQDCNVTNGSGFLPYSFGKEDVKYTDKIEDSIYDNILVISHFSIHPKQRKKIDDNLQSQLINEEGENSYNTAYMRKILLQDFYDQFTQDLIFIERDESLILTFPSNNPEFVLDKNLKFYFNKSVIIEHYIKNNRINSEIFNWLIWDIKKEKDGRIGDIVINSIDEFSSSPLLTTGNLKLKLDEIDQSIYPKLASNLGSSHNNITMEISYQEKKYKFNLQTGGSFTPIWGGCSGYSTGNNKTSRLLYLRDICTKIIPGISDHFLTVEKDWIKNKDVILSQLIEEVILAICTKEQILQILNKME
ncbi:hypothetical protein [uncultured Methanospirillum sp.]|uniref:hypothetical protein n=1 Tax=uncultured Methanospirillum sp. TaxID=262503 RepID=UPI0029C89AAE|nr:hypothetical protein [uncultured Methanospirillum sp.]